MTARFTVSSVAVLVYIAGQLSDVSYTHIVVFMFGL
jgi:hypothetical protein